VNVYTQISFRNGLEDICELQVPAAFLLEKDSIANLMGGNEGHRAGRQILPCPISVLTKYLNAKQNK
jgi:hypothetical protein